MNTRTSPKTSGPTAVQEYERLLIELHQFIASGETSSEAADEIRDQMDLPWQRLSRGEITLVRKLGADLFQLSGDEQYDSAPDKEWVSAVTSTVQSEDWHDVLEKLRQRPPDIPDYDVAVTRALAYGKLGMTQAAHAFAEYALSLQPESGYARLQVLECLVLAGDFGGALGRAKGFSVSSKGDLWWLWFYVRLLAEHFASPDFLVHWRLAQDRLKLALRLEAKGEELPPDLVAVSEQALAACEKAMPSPAARTAPVTGQIALPSTSFQFRYLPQDRLQFDREVTQRVHAIA